MSGSSSRWVDRSATDYDLIVIGGGSGGVRAARVASAHGARVLLAEEYRLGGTCVIRGCVPKKLLVYASHVHGEIRDAAGFGWNIPTYDFDWATLIANKDREVARLEGVYAMSLDTAGVEVVKARATLLGARTVMLGETRVVTARHILLATGSTPNHGERIPGIQHVISSNEVFELDRLPKSIVIQGGGYIALEFACIFAGLGSKVRLVHRGDNVLRGFDQDVRRQVRTEMENAGISFSFGDRVAWVERVGSRLISRLSTGRSFESDEVMFAIGRLPNIAGLGLEAAGVATANGAVVVDEHSRTTAAGIYAIGDVTSRLNLTPVAIREGQAFADSVFGNRPTFTDYSCVPTAVFSQPEIGTVGLSEEAAAETYSEIEIYKTVFRPMKATLSGRHTSIVMKLVVDGSSGVVLGCHIVGPEAAEIVQAVAIAVRMRATKSDFDATMALHPSAAEELVTMRTPAARRVRAAVLANEPGEPTR